MSPGPTVFAQIMASMDQTELVGANNRFPMLSTSYSLRTYDHFAALVFAQLTHRESLRGIDAFPSHLAALTYRMGVRGRVTPEPILPTPTTIAIVVCSASWLGG